MIESQKAAWLWKSSAYLLSWKEGFLLFTEVNYEGKTEICQVNNNS
jgi:hypothetical protein